MRFVGAGQMPLAFAGQEPMGLSARDIDEAQKEQAGYGYTQFVIGPGPRRDPQDFGQDRPALFAIHREADFKQTLGQDGTDIHRAILFMGHMSLFWMCRSTPSPSEGRCLANFDGAAAGCGDDADPADLCTDAPDCAAGNFRSDDRLDFE